MVSTSSTLYEINRILKKACEINVVKPILDPPDWADTYVGPWLLNDLQDCPICSVPYQVNCGEENVHVFDVLKTVIIT